MKPARRSGYALLYLLAALPLIAVIGNTAAVILGEALRAQRTAVVEAANDSALRLLAAQLRRDASTAATATGTEGEYSPSLVLTNSAQTVEYACDTNGITRVMLEAGAEVSRTTWRPRYTECAFRLERLAGGKTVVWFRADCVLNVRQDLPTTRHYATAVMIGEEGAR